MTKFKTDIEIAREARMKPIGDVLGKFNIPDDPFSFSPKIVLPISSTYLTG